MFDCVICNKQTEDIYGAIVPWGKSLDWFIKQQKSVRDYSGLCCKICDECLYKVDHNIPLKSQVDIDRPLSKEQFYKPTKNINRV